MVLRSKSGKLIIINKYDFVNDKLYYEKIRELLCNEWLYRKLLLFMQRMILVCNQKLKNRLETNQTLDSDPTIDMERGGGAIISRDDLV